MGYAEFSAKVSSARFSLVSEALEREACSVEAQNGKVLIEQA
jgi:hypothetical protein